MIQSATLWAVTNVDSLIDIFYDTASGAIPIIMPDLSWNIRALWLWLLPAVKRSCTRCESGINNDMRRLTRFPAKTWKVLFCEALFSISWSVMKSTQVRWRGKQFFWGWHSVVVSSSCVLNRTTLDGGRGELTWAFDWSLWLDRTLFRIAYEAVFPLCRLLRAAGSLNNWHLQ